ncbi:unnamed protein product [Orchesella dallaii]|uniref:Matrin-type domain-containing protein n=1 Tax=Orchesella dallaii TaxID=48710 RepID=A0ABP1QUJ4_9HEXA
MADYWKSLDKKFCDICKCWLADNKASIAFHESGKRHIENVQKRLKDIQKKNKQDEKKEKKLEYDMKMIEQAANAAMKKDMEDNPDMSMKLKAYYEKAGLDPSGGDPDASKPGASTSNVQPKISHRSEKEKKADDAKLAQMHKPAQPYNRSGGWQTIQKDADYDLELPASSTHQFVAKQTVKKRPPITFTEKSVASLNASSSTISSGFSIKTEPDVAFKKRKVDRSNMRRRDDD